MLPATINTFIPVGVLGLVLTGLLGAFMGTFSGTLNAAQAYIINDIYLKYINPKATNKGIVIDELPCWDNRGCHRVFFGFLAENVNAIFQWIVGGLYGGYVAANCLKWYWWRFNANGFFWGMTAGIVGALLMPYCLHGLAHYITGPCCLLFLSSGCFIGTYAAPPTDMGVLKLFYNTVRPWGFWKPVHEKVIADRSCFSTQQKIRTGYV